MEEKKQQCDIELDRDVAQGTYSNLSIISHSSSEFIIDFIRIKFCDFNARSAQHRSCHK